MSIESNMSSGMDVFGTQLEPAPACEELYSDSDRTLIQMMLESGRLRKGSEPVDVERLKQLRSERSCSGEAEKELARLLTYIDWFRHNHCLNLFDEE